MVCKVNNKKIQLRVFSWDIYKTFGKSLSFKHMETVASIGKSNLVNPKEFHRLAEIIDSHGNIRTLLMIVDQLTFLTLPFSNHYQWYLN